MCVCEFLIQLKECDLAFKGKCTCCVQILKYEGEVMLG